MNEDLSFRDVMVQHFRDYTLAYFLAAGYFFSNSMLAFSKLFGELSPGSWSLLGWWQIAAKVAECLLPGVLAVMAFLNTTKAKSDLRAQERRAAEEPIPRLNPVSQDEVFAKLPEPPASSKL